MRRVLPVASTALDKRAMSAHAWPGGWVIKTDDDEFVVLSTRLEVLHRLEVDCELLDVSPTRTGATAIVASGSELAAVDAQRSSLQWHVEGAFLACRAVGSLLWAAEAHGRELELSVRDVDTGRVLRATRIVDPFGDPAVMFFSHPNARSTVVWVAAGQDGQTAYLATDDGVTIQALEIGPRERIPPVFLPDGSAYVSAGEDALELRRWPGGERAGALPLPTSDSVEGEDDDAGDGSGMHILPGGFIAWCTLNGRILLVDLDAVRVVDELSIDGRGDFSYAEPGPDGLILSVHASSQLVATRLADWSPAPDRLLPRAP